MGEAVCVCGHPALQHQARARGRGRCCAITRQGSSFLDFDVCRCLELDDAALPGPGERLEFGTHHLRTTDAEAPAWPIGERAVARRIRKAAGFRD